MHTKQVLITAGPTYEAIDPVRFIGNHSSGLMGFCLAEEAHNRGAKVTLITGPTNLTTISSDINRVDVTSAEEMYDACMSYYNEMDIVIKAAAVADYTPVSPSETKLKKKDSELFITLKRTKDILAELGKRKKHQLLVGFALETNNEIENAILKLKNKNLDFIVLNSLNDKEAGFKKSTNKITIIKHDLSEKSYAAKDKWQVAKDILDHITT